MNEFLIIYAAVIIHEAAHLFACLFLHEQVICLKIMSFGISLKTNFIKNPKHDIIISISGPIASLILFVFSGQSFFKYANILIFSINMFPALPLDGGVFFRSLISINHGYIRSFKILLKTTKVIGVIFVLLGIVLLAITRFNISLLIIGMFLLYNIKYEQNKLILIQKNILCGDIGITKNIFKIKRLGITCDVKLISLIKYFGYFYICEVSVFDKNFKKQYEISQKEIITAIDKYGPSINAGQLIRLDERVDK